MITSDLVRRMAKLSRLGIEEKDIDRFAKQLSTIFEYIEKLNTIDTASVEPTSQVTGLTNIMRKDQEERFSNREDLLACTELPIERDQIKVKAVIK